MRGALFLLLLAFFFLFFCGSRRLRKRSAPSASTFRALLSSQATVSIRASAMFAFGSQGLHAERLASWLRRDAVDSFFSSSSLRSKTRPLNQRLFPLNLNLSPNLNVQSSPPSARRAATSRRSRTCSRPGCRAHAWT